jgi:DNA-binding MarR family transcriptional regulator
MKSESRHELGLLEAVEQDSHATQRRLAAKLGIAVGLTNIYLKRLVRKGYVKCVSLKSNRVIYLLTPSGIAEKTRLTYEYMEYSLRLYREARMRVRSVLAPLVQRGDTLIAIYGAGEAAELAYLCLRELGLEPIAVFSDEGGGTFFGVPVQSIAKCGTVRFDALIVATLDNPTPVLMSLDRLGVTRDKLVPLRQAAA